MARPRSPSRDKARELWEADRARPLVSIAEELGVPEGRVRKWKCEDQWEQGPKGNVPKRVKERSVTEKTDAKLAAMVEANEALTDKQRAFCLHYVKSFNATQAYRRAYGCGYETAMTEGSRALGNPKVVEEIRRLKDVRNGALLATAEDVVELHLRIAFADMTDFAAFNGGVVSLLPSDTVDGQLISKVKQGRAGASLELLDRQKSLAFLERYFELNPMDKHRVAYDNARLEMDAKARDGLGREVSIQAEGLSAEALDKLMG